MTAGQEAFDKLLPKLKAAQYLDLRDLPRTPRGPSESGRFNFFLPSLKGVSPADLALDSTWLSHRDACQVLGGLKFVWSLYGKNH